MAYCGVEIDFNPELNGRCLAKLAASCVRQEVGVNLIRAVHEHWAHLGLSWRSYERLSRI